MSCFLKYFAVLLLMSFICSSGNAITLSPEALQSIRAEAQKQENTSNEVAVTDGAGVINIIVAKIDGSRIYARDGRSFPITDSTRIINNHNRKVKVQTAELFFKDGNLVSILIK